MRDIKELIIEKLNLIINYISVTVPALPPITSRIGHASQHVIGLLSQRAAGTLMKPIHVGLNRDNI